MSEAAADDLRLLQAVFDTLIPPDQDPGGWAGGVARLLDEHGWTVDVLERHAGTRDDWILVIATRRDDDGG